MARVIAFFQREVAGGFREAEVGTDVMEVQRRLGMSCVSTASCGCLIRCKK